MRITNGLVFCGDEKFRAMDLNVVGTEFAPPNGGAEGPVLDAGGCYVIPGLVDVHTHGCVGEDFSDGSAAGWTAMSRAYARQGTTAFLATTMTLPEDTLAAAMDTAAGFVPPEDGARCLGVHLEGPFLSYAKRGAQAAEHLHAPDGAMLMRLNSRSGNQVRLVTVAPEEPGAVAFIRAAKEMCTVSLGHTVTTYDQACIAFDAGACHVTHLYNAMPPLLHREPGLIGAAVDREAWAELICDGLHVHPAAVRCAHALFGDRLLLISDSLRCTGMPDGSYQLGGQPIVMRDGRATLTDGTLAGSSSFLLQCVQKAISFGISPETAIRAATSAPADSIGVGHCAGRILPGRRADFLLLNPDFTLRQVFLSGRPLP